MADFQSPTLILENEMMGDPTSNLAQQHSYLAERKECTNFLWVLFVSLPD